MLRLGALLCFVAGLLGLLWVNPAFGFMFGQESLLKGATAESRELWEQSFNHDQVEREILVTLWTILILSIGSCALGVFLWRKRVQKIHTEPASVLADGDRAVPS